MALSLHGSESSIAHPQQNLSTFPQSLNEHLRKVSISLAWAITLTLNGVDVWERLAGPSRPEQTRTETLYNRLQSQTELSDGSIFQEIRFQSTQ